MTVSDLPRPTVSVIVPTFDRAASIAGSVESVLNQTYEVLEVLVVDDGSSDGTAEVVAAIEDPRVRYLRHDLQGGASAARNSGIEEAKGEVIAFLDSDDTWKSTKIETQIAMLDDGGSPPVGLVVCGYRVHRQTGQRTGLADVRTISRRRSYLALRHGALVTSCFLVPRWVFDEGLRFDASLPALEDYDLALRILERYRIVAAPGFLVDKDADPNGGRLFSGRAVTVSRERLIGKYAPELRIRPGAMARHYRALALAYAQASQPQKAREALIMAHRHAPLRPATIAMRLAATFGSRGLAVGGAWIAKLEGFTPRLLAIRVADVVGPRLRPPLRRR